MKSGLLAGLLLLAVCSGCDRSAPSDGAEAGTGTAATALEATTSSTIVPKAATAASLPEIAWEDEHLPRITPMDPAVGVLATFGWSSYECGRNCAGLIRLEESGELDVESDIASFTTDFDPAQLKPLIDGYDAEHLLSQMESCEGTFDYRTYTLSIGSQRIAYCDFVEPDEPLLTWLHATRQTAFSGWIEEQRATFPLLVVTRANPGCDEQSCDDRWEYFIDGSWQHSTNGQDVATGTFDSAPLAERLAAGETFIDGSCHDGVEFRLMDWFVPGSPSDDIPHLCTAQLDPIDPLSIVVADVIADSTGGPRGPIGPLAVQPIEGMVAGDVYYEGPVPGCSGCQESLLLDRRGTIELFGTNLGDPFVHFDPDQIRLLVDGVEPQAVIAGRKDCGAPPDEHSAGSLSFNGYTIDLCFAELDHDHPLVLRIDELVTQVHQRRLDGQVIGYVTFSTTGCPNLPCTQQHQLLRGGEWRFFDGDEWIEGSFDPQPILAAIESNEWQADFHEWNACPENVDRFVDYAVITDSESWEQRVASTCRGPINHANPVIAAFEAALAESGVIVPRLDVD